MSATIPAPAPAPTSDTATARATTLGEVKSLPTPNATNRILIAGDSITQGSSADYTWRYRLWAKLNGTAPGQVFTGSRTDLYDHVRDQHGSNNYIVSFNGKNHDAIWGHSFYSAKDTIGSRVSAANPDVLVVLLGSNDLSYISSPQQTIDSARSYIQAARQAKPGIDIVIGQVLNRYDVWTQECVLVNESNAYATLLTGLAVELNTTQERVVVAPTRTGWDAKIHTWDGTHPNPTGEALIAQRVSQGLSSVGIGTTSPNIAGPKTWPVAGPTVTVTPRVEAADLTWSRATVGATGVYLEVRLTQTGEGWQRLPYPVSADSWTMTALVAGGTYQFRTVPTKGSNVGSPGPLAGRTISGPPLGMPGPMTATVTGQLTAVSTWSKGTNSTGYLLGKRDLSAQGGWYQYPYAVPDLNWEFYGYEGRYHDFRVRSTRGFITSSWRTSPKVRLWGIPSGRVYAALGDSYSSGQGASGPFTGGSCLRTVHAWAYDIQPPWVSTLAHLACSGAKTGDMPNQIAGMSQVFAANADRPKLISLTIGGNNIGWGDFLTECVVGLSSCTAKKTEMEGTIDAVKAPLKTLYASIRSQNPYADIIVGGYPHIIALSGNGSSECLLISSAERHLMDNLTVRLNSRIQSAASESGVWWARNIPSYFEGHEACSIDYWINPYSPGDSKYHPNNSGQLAYAIAFSDSLVYWSNDR